MWARAGLLLPPGELEGVKPPVVKGLWVFCSEGCAQRSVQPQELSWVLESRTQPWEHPCPHNGSPRSRDPNRQELPEI